jgi:hypothetical protein
MMTADSRSPAEPGPYTGNGDTRPLMIARGLGGRLELYHHSIRITRHGYVNYLLSWLAGRPAFVDVTVPLHQVASLDFVHPVLLNAFVCIAYPGSPPLSGESLRDSMAENALLMNFFDNRDFYAIKRRFRLIIGSSGAQTPVMPTQAEPAGSS